MTSIYFIPTMVKLMNDRISPESEAVATAVRWMNLGYIRHFATLIARLAALKALSRSGEHDG